MKIGIISDIHDHIAKLKKALQALASVDELICCGDLCSPFIIRHMAQGFSGNIHIVFGNNDADLFRITTTAGKFPNIFLYGELCIIEFDGKRFAINHFDNIGRALAASDEFDVVCFGHNHEFEISTIGETLLINPGEIMGEIKGCSSCVIYDTQTHVAKRIDL